MTQFIWCSHLSDIGLAHGRVKVRVKYPIFFAQNIIIVALVTAKEFYVDKFTSSSSSYLLAHFLSNF